MSDGRVFVRFQGRPLSDLEPADFATTFRAYGSLPPS
jgi:hypothetical protein